MFGFISILNNQMLKNIDHCKKKCAFSPFKLQNMIMLIYNSQIRKMGLSNINQNMLRRHFICQRLTHTFEEVRLKSMKGKNFSIDTIFYFMGGGAIQRYNLLINK